MAKKRIFEDHALTVDEKNWRFQEKAASIDDGFNEALAKIDWERRNEAQTSLVSFIETYCIGILLDDKPSAKAKECLAQFDSALRAFRPQQLMLPRGAGKTSFAECAALYLLSYGLRKFLVIVSQNSRSAGNILKDIWRMIAEKDTAFANDFPEVCFPFHACNGAFRRRQTYNGVSTEIQRNASNIQFARLVGKDNREYKTSGSVMTVRGIGSGIRGLKVGRLRPDAVILDDLQDSQAAANPEQVEKISDLINKDILNLSSKGKMSVVMTSTPIQDGDLTDKICNDVSWKTTKYKAIMKFPKDIEDNPDTGLWSQYFKLFDNENIDDIPHESSLKFYRENKAKMDEGAVLFQPDRFKESDGHISGLQALLEKRHLIGEAAFQAEMQMQPFKTDFALNITPNVVATKINQFDELVVPDGYVFVAGAIDLNVSFGMTYALVAFKTDNTSIVLHHDIYRVKIDQKLSETAYNQRVYEELQKLCTKIKMLGIKIDGIAIDAGGRNWDAVCQFCNNAQGLVGLPCCAFAGRAANVFNPYVRTRLRDSINRTVLCGNAQEHVKAGAGQKYCFFDADLYKENVQRAFLQQVGSVGSCSLYKATTKEHTEFAIQICNEKLVSIQTKKDGRNIYTWKSKNDHDFLDVMSMTFAVAASQGISGSNFAKSSQKSQMIQANIRRLKKKAIKIV